MSEIDGLRSELERLKNWAVDLNSSPSEFGQKLLAIADLNLKAAELLLRKDLDPMSPLEASLREQDATLEGDEFK